jgi:hypothetical protein
MRGGEWSAAGRLEQVWRPEDENHQRAEGGAFPDLVDDPRQTRPLRSCPEHPNLIFCINYVPIMFSFYSKVKND